MADFTIRRLAEMLQNTGIDNDFDVVAGCTGMEGSGKSTFLIQLGIELCKVRELDFKIKENIVYTVEQEKTAHEIGKRGFPVIYDEAVDFVLKYEWNTEKQMKMAKAFTKIRSKGLIMLFSLPYFSDFTPYFRKNRLRFWFYIPKRGVALVFRKSKNQFAADSWYFKENSELVGKYYKSGGEDLDSMVMAFSRSPNFVGTVNFEELPKEVSKEYLVWKEENVFKEAEEKPEEEAPAYKNLKKLVLLLRTFPKALRLTHEEIGGVIGYSRTGIDALERAETNPDSISTYEHLIKYSTNYQRFLKKCGGIDSNLSKLLFTDQNNEGETDKEKEKILAELNEKTINNNAQPTENEPKTSNPVIPTPSQPAITKETEKNYD